MIIGIGGPKGHGKSTFAEFVQENSRKPIEIVETSAPLLQALLTLNPYLDSGQRFADEYENVGYVQLKKNPEVRRLLQTLGTDIVRDMIDENAWVKMAEKTSKNYESNGANVLLTGVRFANELRIADWSLYINRPKLSTATDVHSSETSLTSSDFNETIENTSYLALEDAAKQIIQRLEL